MELLLIFKLVIKFLYCSLIVKRQACFVTELYSEVLTVLPDRSGQTGRQFVAEPRHTKQSMHAMLHIARFCWTLGGQ